jgi:hypothetical protein
MGYRTSARLWSGLHDLAHGYYHGRMEDQEYVTVFLSYGFTLTVVFTTHPNEKDNRWLRRGMCPVISSQIVANNCNNRRNSTLHVFCMTLSPRDVLI